MTEALLIPPGGAAPARVLVVDDDLLVRTALVRVMQRQGYDVVSAGGTDEALELIERDGEVHLVISDLHMPGADGMVLLRELQSRFPDTAVIMLTGDDEVTSAVACLQLGASDYLTKPPTVQAIRARAAKALKDRAIRVEVQRLRESYQSDLKRQIRSLLRKTQTQFVAQVQMAVTMLEAKDLYTRGHSRRVAEYAFATGRELQLDTTFLAELRLGGELHDIGKIGTRDAILNKPGALTAEEFAEVRLHTIDGEKMLRPLRREHPTVMQIVRSHHEKVDGSGFPDGLIGSRIPLAARIVAVVDAYDAMTTTRAYRKQQSHQEARRELERFAGVQFDREVVSAFLRAFPEGAAMPVPIQPQAVA